MYYINSNVEHPDAEYLRYRIEQSVNKVGIQLSEDIFDIKDTLMSEVAEKLSIFCSNYGIENPNSSSQIKAWMENNFSDDELAICTDLKGKVSSKKEVLIDLVHAGNQFACDLIEYRKSKKQLEALESLINLSDSHLVIRPEVSLGNTNRINYKSPALMNIPKGLLWKVVAPRKAGNILVSADIKNQEPWILINWLGMEDLKQAIKDNKDGLYNAIYKKIFGSDPNELERKECKTAWNALTYGGTKKGLKRICKNIDGDKIYQYFSHIEEMKEFKGHCWKLAVNKVRKTSTYFGTEVYPDAVMSSALQRQHMDFPIQGTGSDILSLLVSHFDEAVDEAGLSDDIELYYSRHDEIIFEVSKEFFEDHGEDGVLKIIRDITEHQVDNWEPFNIEVSIVSNNVNIDADDDSDEE